MISAFQEMCINAGLLHVPDGKTNDMEKKLMGRDFTKKKEPALTTTLKTNGQHIFS